MCIAGNAGITTRVIVNAMIQFIGVGTKNGIALMEKGQRTMMHEHTKEKSKRIVLAIEIIIIGCSIIYAIICLTGR